MPDIATGAAGAGSGATLPVVDVRRNALDDGPGIRTTVFTKGCPLACVWCQNPETLSPRPQLQREGGRCIGCGTCARTCPHGATTRDGEQRRHDPSRCRLCGACVAACPPRALRIAGAPTAVEALVERLLADEPFFRGSGGGVTFSGGEPTLHLSAVAHAARLLHARGVHVLLETCGLYPARRFEEVLLPHLDAVYFDVKLADPAAHRRHTGQENGVILANLRRLAGRPGLDLLPRVPLVPGITDTAENLTAVADLLAGVGLRRVALLPYNPLWLPKRRELGLELPYGHDRHMPAAEVERCRALVAARGLTVL